MATGRRKLASEVVMFLWRRRESRIQRSARVGRGKGAVSRGRKRRLLKEESYRQRREAKGKREVVVGRGDYCVVEQGTGGCDRRCNVLEMWRRRNARALYRTKDAATRARQGVCSCAEKKKGRSCGGGGW